jgi:glycosyltransferase involved in cell wall biosynthesis
MPVPSPSVSVVIPLHNKVRHIRRAIDSVLGQTRQDFELIVVDDGSTDGSGDVVQQISDSRVRLIVQDNAGVSAARNRGIEEAGCGLVAFLDADDEWLPSFLGTVMGLRVRAPEAGMYATAYQCSHDGKTWRPTFAGCVTSPRSSLLEDYFCAALGTAPVWSSGVMIPRQILDEVGCFPVGVGHGEDLRTWAAIALRYRVAWSSESCAVYHLSADNRACGSTFTAPDVAAATVIEEFLRSGRAPVSSRRMVEEYLVSRRLAMAVDCYLQGRRKWAQSLLGRTRHTTMFKSRRFLLRCMLWVPPVVSASAMSLRTRLRRPPPRRKQQAQACSVP